MKFLESLEKYLLLAILFLLPLFILPAFANPYDPAKISLLVFGVCLFLVVKALKTIVKGSLEYSLGTFDLPVLIMILAYLLAAIFRTPNKMDAFFLPGTATIVIGSGLLYFFLNSLGAREKRAVSLTLFFSGVVSAVIFLLAFTGVFAKLSSLPVYLRDLNFTTFGGLLPAAIYFGATAILGLGLTLSEEDLAKKGLFGISLAVLILGLGLSLYNLLPGKTTSPTLPPFETSWAVGVETLKVSPLLGIGPGNYLTAFNRYRPVSYNNTDLWPLRFTTGADFPLTTLTETGLLGLIGFGLLLFLFLKNLKSQSEERDLFSLVSLGVVFLLLLALPGNPTLIVLFFALLALFSRLHTHNLGLSTEGNKLPAYLLSLPVIVLVAILGYFSIGVVSAETAFKSSLDALTKNDGKATYELLRRAITTNPYVDRYHATYAQVNLALARSIAQKQEITDEDRQTVAQLIQQAIREGKATVTLNASRSGNWEVLARTYQAIMPFAQGADNFTIQTFTQAIALDPVNPNLRIALGGVYYALGRYDEAMRAFELAVIAKPNLANAHYNLAIALREKGEIEKAIAEMNAVLSLVEKDSPDYSLAKTELDNLDKRRAAKATEGTENLTPPATAEEPLIRPQLTLPEEATPPATTP